MKDGYELEKILAELAVIPVVPYHEISILGSWLKLIVIFHLDIYRSVPMH